MAIRTIGPVSAGTDASSIRGVSMSRLWVFLAIALPMLASLVATLSTVDLTYQLRAGSEILGSRAIPAVDSWTFTAAGLPWVDQQWGAQVVLAAADRLGSWTALALLRAILVGVIFGALVIIGLRRGLDGRTASLLSLAAFLVAAPALALRPQLLGMACFAIVLLLVTDQRAHSRRLWLVPVVVVVWANLHGSFVLAPLVLGLAWLEDLHDRIVPAHRALLVAVVSGLTACVTPFGPKVWLYAVGLSTNPEVTARISEWLPTSIRDLTGLLFLASALGVVVLIARRGRVTPWPTLAWLGTFFVIGLYAQRGVAWWSLAAVAAIAGTLVTSLPDRSADRVTPPLLGRVNLVVAGVLVVAMLALLPTWRPVDPATGVPSGTLAQAPPGVTAALRAEAHPGDRVFNPQPWGSWFEYAFPDLLVAIDSRIELFPAEVWRQYGDVVAGVDGWQARLEAWGVTIVVVGTGDSAFADRLEANGWRVVRPTAEGSLFRRRP
jgi:hypothetical protein